MIRDQRFDTCLAWLSIPTHWPYSFKTLKKFQLAPKKLDIRVQIDWCNCYQTKNEEMSYQNADHLKIMNERFSQELDEVQI